LIQVWDIAAVVPLPYLFLEAAHGVIQSAGQVWRFRGPTIDSAISENHE
jgi:hypothetical protein